MIGTYLRLVRTCKELQKVDRVYHATQEGSRSEFAKQCLALSRHAYMLMQSLPRWVQWMIRNNVLYLPTLPVEKRVVRV